MSFGVYAIIFPDDRVYIGSTVNDFKYRIMQHMNGLKRGKHSNVYLQRIYNKYKEFEVQILEICSDEKVVTIREQLWIEAQDEKLLLNIGSAHPGPMYNKTHSITTRLKISKSVSKALIGNTYRKGCKLSDEQKQQISIFMKGRKLSVESRRKLSDSLIGNKYMIGVKQSEEWRANISKAMLGNENGVGNKSHLGKKQSDATKKKISETLKRRHSMTRLHA